MNTTSQTQTTRRIKGTPHTQKDRFTMTRILTASLLALGIASATVASSPTSFASTRTRAPAATGDHRASPREAALVRTASSFGYAMVNGPDARINSFATPRLIARAPSQHLINLMGPAQNPPRSFQFSINSYTSSRAVGTMKFLWGASGLFDRTVWTHTAAGWKLADLRYVRSTPDRGSLMATNYTFAQAIKAGASG